MDINKPYLIKTQREFIEFLVAFAEEKHSDPKLWGRNVDLDDFLRAMIDSAVSVRNIYENMDWKYPEQPTWGLFAQIVSMASDYE
jgi:hypothetical protein